MRVPFVRSSPLKAAAAAVAIYLLPSLGSPWLGTAAPWLGAASAWLLLVSQPAVQPKALRSHSSRDRGSAALIFGSMIGTQFVAVVEYRLGGGLLPIGALEALLTGPLLVALGFALRLWAIETLGQFFTSTVEISAEHRVVRSGPYAWVRHPSYTGALLIAVGTLLIHHGATGLVLFVLAVVPAYAYRIWVEERALSEKLGASYDRYRSSVPALVPRWSIGPRRRAAWAVAFALLAASQQAW